MKNDKKGILGLVSLVIFLLALAPSGVIIDDNLTESYYDNDNFDLKSAGLWILTSAILIDDTVPVNNWATTVSTYDWCSGYGNSTHPYVIEDIVMDLSGSGTCITIQNSNVYFIIENCSFSNAQYGIKLDNDTNGWINDITIYNLDGSNGLNGTGGKPASDGTDGMESVGININDCTNISILYTNITDVRGGYGGNGGNGDPGVSGSTTGGNGGEGGSGGLAHGIYVYNSREISLSNNNISTINGGNGGNGGKGGDGHTNIFFTGYGGYAGDGGIPGEGIGVFYNNSYNVSIQSNMIININGGAGGNGGIGGDSTGSGRSGRPGATGISGGNAYAIFLENSSTFNISSSEISNVNGGDGGDGGEGGYANDGYGAVGGAGASGGDGIGIYNLNRSVFSIISNTIENINGGEGGTGGKGGNSVGARNGPIGGNGGTGGFAYGIYLYQSSENDINIINNNDISSITGGTGGAGGKGGDATGLGAGNGGAGGGAGAGNHAYGILIMNFRGNITHTKISSITGGDGGNGGDGGITAAGSGGAGGAGATGGSGTGIHGINSSIYSITFNSVENINGGNGGDGGIGAISTGNNFQGGAGGAGITGGIAYGIFLENSSTFSVSSSEISNVIGGDGGAGGAGGDTSGLFFGSANGGAGGAGSAGNHAYGIITTISNGDITYTNISNIYGGNAGNGGDGGTTALGSGGAGGAGATGGSGTGIQGINSLIYSIIFNHADNINGGNGSDGGLAGNSVGAFQGLGGGISGAGGIAYGIYLYQSSENDIAIVKNNDISSITGGTGGTGGKGGDSTGLGAGNGGAGGAAGAGNHAYGIFIMNSRVNITYTNISSINGGNAGNGGAGGTATAGYGGMGGAGATGGSGVGIYGINSSIYSITFNSVENINGGNGGDGGITANSAGAFEGLGGGIGGAGGIAYGIYFYPSSENDITIINYNDIYSITGGIGGIGGNGGAATGLVNQNGGVGGNGGNGGLTVGLYSKSLNNSRFTYNIIEDITGGFGGTGGNGGAPAGFATGGAGGNGGAGGDCYGMNFETSLNLSISSNKIINTVSGNGGSGGSGGVGWVNGAPGSVGISSWDNGMRIFNCNESKINDNYASDSFWGFALSSSYQNNFSINTAYNCENSGIVIYLSLNNIINQNNATSNGYGIFINGCNDYDITENILNSNTVGINLLKSNNTFIMGNIFNGNTNYKTETDTQNNDCRFNIIDEYLSHVPIIIDDSGFGNFTWEEAAELLLWCYGSGTVNDPYIFEDIKINGGNSESCIIVKNSNVSFIIRNCLITNAGNNAGIKLDNVANGTLSNNNCSSNNLYGIYLENDCINCTIDGNIFDDNIYGIYVKNSTTCVISSNNITNCISMTAIFLDASINCNLQSNIMINCSVDLNVTILIQGTSHSMGTSNLINGKPLYYYSNTAGAIVNAGQVILVNCGAGTISNSNVSNCAMGIILISCNNIIINNIIANENLIGIDIRDGNTNSITDSTICFNYNYGIKINTSNTNTITSSCNISYNKMSGIWIYNSDYSTISNSDINYNEQHGIHLIHSDQCTISGNNLMHNTNNGIHLDPSESNTISGNSISYNNYGIYMNGTSGTSNNNDILGNTIEHNTNNGIHLDASESNEIISTNIIAFNQHGIYLDGTSGSCNNNRIANNVLYNNTDCGIYVNLCHYTILSGNSISNTTNNGIYLNTCNYTIISSDTITNSINGIYLDSSCNATTITGCTISNCTSYGISFNGGTSNTISSNTFNYNILGIYLDGNSYSCDNNNILGNTMVSNTVPIRFEFGHNNTISGNTISYTLVGIQLYDSNYNYFSSNVVQNNAWFGLQLSSSDSNTFTGNTFSNTTVNECVILYGTGTDCDNNKFYNNYFRWNLVAHARDDGTSNTWTYGSIGNYWDNYTGVDADFNGIGDIPYIYIKGSAGAQDALPIWDSDIVISAPVDNALVGITPPDFIIGFNDPNVDTTWYTIDGGLTNFIFTENGQINEMHWQELWNTISNGDIITFRIYFNTTYGYLVFKEISLVKYIPPDYTPLIMMVALISLISAASLAVVGVLYVKRKKKKAKAALPAFSDKLISKKGKAFAESLSLTGELSQSEYLTPIPSESDGEYILSRELKDVNEELNIIPEGTDKEDIISAIKEQKSTPTDQPQGIAEHQKVQEQPIEEKELYSKPIKDYSKSESIVAEEPKTKSAIEIISESDDPHEWYVHGMTLLEKGELDAAAECFDAVIKEQPLNSDAWYFLGETNEKLGKFDAAMKCYDEAIKVRDLSEDITLTSSPSEIPSLIEEEIEEHEPIQEVEDSKPPTSEELIESMITGVQKDVEFVKNGRRFERIGNLEEAIKCYDAALQENPENVEAWFNKGKIFEKLGYSELAQEAIDKVYELTKDD